MAWVPGLTKTPTNTKITKLPPTRNMYSTCFFQIDLTWKKHMKSTVLSEKNEAFWNHQAVWDGWSWMNTIWPHTLPKTNIGPENWCGKMKCPFGMAQFQGLFISFREGNIFQLDGGFTCFFIFTPTGIIWGRFPFGLIFCKWVETTNLSRFFRERTAILTIIARTNPSYFGCPKDELDIKTQHLLARFMPEVLIAVSCYDLIKKMSRLCCFFVDFVGSLSQQSSIITWPIIL